MHATIKNLTSRLFSWIFSIFLLTLLKQYSIDVNDIWLRWKTFLLDILEKHMPTTEFRLKADKIPYINAQAKQMIRQRDYLRAKANKTGSNILRQAYILLELGQRKHTKFYTACRLYWNSTVKSHFF